MKSLDSLYAKLQDASLSLDADMSRDWITIQSRFQHEGLSFLTITLPAFASWLEQSIEAEHALTTIFPSFRKAKYRAFPCFLQGLTSRVFDSRTGDLLPQADPSAVFFIRTICTYFKKVKLPCSRARQRLAVKKFVDTDVSLPDHIVLDNVTLSVANVVVSSLKYFLQDDSLPKHGKGATYEKISGNRKYEVREFYERWIGVLDPEELYGFDRPGDHPLITVSLESEKPCRLSLVPKTLKSPRVIAVEPVAMQFAQQLVADRLISAMRSSPLTRHIDFTDQSVNRGLAKKGSLDGSVATIDLSEASDRVSLSLVNALFQSDTVLLEQLLACRSTAVEIPSDVASAERILVLRKYSTSGSALTFPVETLVFFILSLSAVVKKSMGSGSLMRSISQLAPTVSVYGDDIVVPSHACSEVIRSLEALGLKVNTGKTFYKGLFRESCGGDYFKGYDVTPVYLRHLLPDTSKQSDAFASSVATSNILWRRGCWRAADSIRKHIDQIYRLPRVLPTCPGLGWTSHGDDQHDLVDEEYYDKVKVLKNNNHGVRTLVSRTKPVSDKLSGYSALLKHFLSRGVQEDKDHLVQSVPRFRSGLFVSWVTPY